MCTGSMLCNIKGFLMKISLCEYHYSLKDSKQSFSAHLTVNRKPQYPKTLPVTTRPTISEVGPL